MTRFPFRVKAVLVLWVMTAPPATAQTVPDQQIIESGRLNRFEPLDPDEAVSSFEIAPGFRIELVAAEPLVTDPIAFCFDAKGRLIVVEMRGYSERRESQSGRVRRLSDRDGDGRMDEGETLIDGLKWPTAVACWGDGIVIGAAPDILYLPLDVDPADRRPQRWFTGFGTSNVQGLFNSFRWGPDLRLHGATSSSGGEVSGETLTEPIRLGRRDFAIDFHSRELTPVAGGGQHGMSFNRWGDKFVCSNSDHLQQVLVLSPIAARSSHFSSEPPFRRSIASDGPQAEVFRISPVEPWRILRTHLRVTGQARGPIEGGGRAAGYFTGATGVHLYEGDQWHVGDEEIALVCDVGSNLVHRKRLTREGLWYRGERIDEKTEFLRSTDTWFRPVQLGGGPDGALYIADMYREVIEHPKSLPPSIKSQTDLNSGNDRGRIWRIVSTEHRIRGALTRPLDELPAAELAVHLTRENAWNRRTAARLLAHTSNLDESDVELIRKIAIECPRPEARLEALAVLNVIPNGLDQATRDAALDDRNRYVRWRAVALAAQHAGRLGTLSTKQAKLALADGLSRFALAYAAPVLIDDTGEMMEWEITEVDPWLLWAVEGSVTTRGVLDHRLKDEHFARSPFAKVALFQVLHSENENVGRALVAAIEDPEIPEQIRDTILDLLAEEIQDIKVTGTLRSIRKWALDTGFDRLLAQSEPFDAPTDPRLLSLLGWANRSKSIVMLERLVTPKRPPETQRLAIKYLVNDDKAAHRFVLSHLPEMTPAVQSEAWSVLTSHRVGLQSIAASVRLGELDESRLPANVRDAMARSPDKEVQAVLEEVDQGVAVGLDRYADSLHKAGDPNRGAELFKRLCATCHQPEPGAAPVGPELKSIVDKTPEQIAWSIVDPNREVDPRYHRVQILTQSGRIFGGVLLAESDTSLTIVDEKGQQHSVRRGEIETLKTSKQSLMPDNLAEQISPEQMSDLIAHLKRL